MPTVLQSATGPVRATEAPLPVAWMGYKADGKGGFIVRVCCYGCAGKTEAEKIAKDAGFPVSHGCCRSCYQTEQIAMAFDTP